MDADWLLTTRLAEEALDVSVSAWMSDISDLKLQRSGLRCKVTRTFFTESGLQPPRIKSVQETVPSVPPSTKRKPVDM